MALETSPEQPAPVRQIANLISGWVDRLGVVWVEGQVAQLSRRQGMNTVFLTLRDPVADVSISVTCSRQLFDSMNPPLVEGAGVVVHAKPSYYANRGTLSLRASDIRMIGLGELLARIERRRQLLAAEGLFAAERKRPLPFLPRRVGLVTGGGSAAERDVLEVARRRWPAVDFRVLHTAVQGPQAAAEMMAALGRLDRDPEVDVIVIARGGGSVEDLLPFSDEGLVRAVAQARTPVVSAIGHEPDSPLLDLVADRRAATPTDAAKIVVPDVAEETDRIRHARDRLRAHLATWIAREQHALDAIRARPSLANPARHLTDRAAEVDQLRDRARRTLGHRLDRAGDDLGHQLARVRSLSPLATLRRGYAVVQDADGHVVTTVDQVATETTLQIRVVDGRIAATVTAASPDPGSDADVSLDSGVDPGSDADVGPDSGVDPGSDADVGPDSGVDPVSDADVGSDVDADADAPGRPAAARGADAGSGAGPPTDEATGADTSDTTPTGNADGSDTAETASPPDARGTTRRRAR